MDTDNTLHRVLVYGTLMHGEGNHELLAEAAYLGPVRTAPAFTLLSLGGFPAAVPGGTAAIAGELYLCDADTLRRLDRLEGHPTFYRRTEIALPDGATAEIYLLVRDVPERALTPIPSGSWRVHRGLERARTLREAADDFEAAGDRGGARRARAEARRLERAGKEAA